MDDIRERDGETLSDEQQFERWFMDNYPPGSTINDPAWHAKRIWLQAGRARSEESGRND